MTLALLNAANSDKVNGSFASTFIDHTVVAAANIFIEHKVLHHSCSHRQTHSN